MTDRIKGLTISLSHDIRNDDCQPIIDAIRMIKGIEDVMMHVTDVNDWMARKHVKSELRDIVSEWFKAL